MRSVIYTGQVAHRRFAPQSHDLRYRVYSLLLELDELDELDRSLRWFSVDRFNLMSFRRRDHGPRDGSPLRPWAQNLMADAGVDIGDGRIQLLVYPRILGYGFDPLTVWYCHDEAGRLAGVIHEVRNTFGEYHCYVAPVASLGSVVTHTTEKVFHVSPFFDVDGRYDFRLTRPGRSVSVVIDYSDGTGPLLTASFSGVRSEMSDRNLARRFWDHPLVSFRVIAGIHWEALKLLRKRVGFRSKPEPPSAPVTYIARQEGSIR
ncbi:MAG TPA: DUF1365 domain-containing protein [Acidimicrobiia bacterium]|jgi:DUF1365 family protein